MEKESNVDLFYHKLNELILNNNKFIQNYISCYLTKNGMKEISSYGYLDCLLDLYQDYVKSCVLNNKEDIKHYEKIIFSKKGKINHDFKSVMKICHVLNKDIFFNNNYLLSLPSMEVKEKNGKKYFKYQHNTKYSHQFIFNELSVNMFLFVLYDEEKRKKESVLNQKTMKIKMKLDYIYHHYRNKLFSDFL